MQTKYTNHDMSNRTNQYGHEYAIGETGHSIGDIFQIGKRVTFLTQGQKQYKTTHPYKEIQ